MAAMSRRSPPPNNATSYAVTVMDSGHADAGGPAVVSGPGVVGQRPLMISPGCPPPPGPPSTRCCATQRRTVRYASAAGESR